jgi:superoxide dismutase
MPKENGRRKFFRIVTEAGVVLAFASANGSKICGENVRGADIAADTDKYGIVMANLPYEAASLDPWIFEKTINLYYFTHYRSYSTMLQVVVQDGEAVKVYRSEYNDTPLLKGYEPLLAIDVWEHAYYLDYLYDRQKYVEAALDHLLNWTQAEKNLSSAASGK